jgi:cytochrome c5
LETLSDFTTVAKTGLLMKSINQVAGISAMPKGGSKLSACDITKIGILVRTLVGTNQPPTSTCSPDTVYFTNTLEPLIVSSCGLTGCHNGSGQNPTLLTYANIRNNVSPGNPNSSRLYTVLNNSGEDGMPRSPVAKFTTAQKLLVYTWIQQEAKNNSCVDTNCDTTAVTYSSTISSIMETNCIGCHSTSGSSTTKLDSYTGVKAVVTSGKLVGAIDHLAGFVAMPPGGSLSVCDNNKIKAWIKRGALNN